MQNVYFNIIYYTYLDKINLNKFTYKSNTEKPEGNYSEKVNFAFGFARERCQRRYHHTVKI